MLQSLIQIQMQKTYVRCQALNFSKIKKFLRKKKDEMKRRLLQFVWMGRLKTKQNKTKKKKKQKKKKLKRKNKIK